MKVHQTCQSYLFAYLFDSFCPLITLSDRVRYNSLRGAHDIHFNMSGHAVTQSDTAQPEKVIMVRGVEMSEKPEPEPTGCCGAPKDLMSSRKDLSRREVYTTTSNGEKVLVRLNIHLKGGQGCFEPVPMLRLAGDRATVPPALEKLGMTWDEYHEIFVRQLSEIEDRHFSEGCCYSFVFVAPKFLCCLVASLATLGCALNFFMRKGEEHKKRMALPFDADLREWQTNANATLRQKYPIHIKTQSHSWIKPQGDSAKRCWSRWIAVALNEEDAAQLMSEPHLHGLVVGGEPPPCAGAVPPMDENTFCVHPYEQIRSDM